MLSTTREISYKGDNSDRRALLDLVRWFGFKRSRVIWKEFRNAKVYITNHPEWDPTQFLNGSVMAIEFGGVSGHPVRCLIRKFFGDEVLQAWIES